MSEYVWIVLTKETNVKRNIIKGTEKKVKVKKRVKKESVPEKEVNTKGKRRKEIEK